MLKQNSKSIRAEFSAKNFTLIELLINDACFTWVYVLY